MARAADASSDVVGRASPSAQNFAAEPAARAGGLPSGAAVWVSGAVVVMAIAAGQLPLLGKFLSDLGRREQYEFYPLLLIAAGVLAAMRLSSVPARALRRGGWGITATLLGVGLTCSVIGSVFYMRWLAAPAAWLTLSAAVWRLGGPAVARALAPVGVLLLVIIPPPMHLDEVLTRALQRLAVRQSSALLDLLHVPHVMTGTVLELPGHRLMIEEACSGINSLLSVLAFTLLFAFLKRRPPAFTVALLASAVWFVLCANVGRIVLGAVALARFRVDLLDESVHQMTGLVLFLVCLGLVASADQSLLLVAAWFRGQWHPRNRVASNTDNRGAAGSEPDLHEPRQSPAAVSSTPLFSPPGWPWWVFAAVCVAAGIASHARVKNCWPVSSMPGMLALKPPQEVGPWTRADEARTSERAENFGKYCHRWHYVRRTDGVVAEVALAYPFTTGYHDPAVCYAAAGWNVLDRVVHDAKGERESSEAKPYFERSLSKLSGMSGHVFFAAFDEQGKWHASPKEAIPQGSLQYRLWIAAKVASLSPTHEVQTLIVSRDALTEADRRDAEQLFLGVREVLAIQALNHLPGRQSSESSR